ncbi:WD40 repeat domain-containing protein [Dactylosporangium sp. McL0621]|uniref:WD40 repeat domain-containing protein n=1 Tax=Dactylosporangium sp. McL0621 TaxID=3415678 RepID=UPI003CF76278
MQSLAFSPDGKTIASVANNGDYSVRLWDVATATNVRTLNPGGKGFGGGAVAFSPDGTTLATVACEDNVVRLWNVHELLPQPTHS